MALDPPQINVVETLSVVSDRGGGNYSSPSVDTMYSTVLSWEAVAGRQAEMRDLIKKFRATSRFNTIYLSPTAKNTGVGVSLGSDITQVTDGTTIFLTAQFNVTANSSTQTYRVPTMEAGTEFTVAIASVGVAEDMAVIAYAYIPDNREVVVNG